ncbi:MAG: hypothetical protein IJN46_09290, partial [Lachnospiraceae bacterium]|nr:hypothetical protein [Lachnospiraceae bacterium]
MKQTRKLIAVVLSILVIFSACSPAGTESTQDSTAENTTSETTTEEITTEEALESTEGEPLSPEEQILEDRRNTVVDYMRDMLTVLWRAETDVEYQLSTGYPLSIKAGRVYSGLPYTFGCGTTASFLEGAGAPDAKGVYTIPGNLFDALSGSTSDARVGIDCSSAVFVAWAQIGASVIGSAPEYMYEDYGFIKVGEYETKTYLNRAGKPRLDNTVWICMDNGREVMYEAYAKLKKGDMLTSVPGSGNHVIMVTDVNIVYKNEIIDGKKSYITVIDQARTKQSNETRYENAELGETVYVIGTGEDHGLTFDGLYDKGYLPYTCKELIDPSPLPAPEVSDSETKYSYENLLIGKISSNWAIDVVTLTITDNAGKMIQEATGRSVRGSWVSGGEKQREFDL